MELDIFGSCISRDPFEFSSSNFKPGKYMSRSSLVSTINKIEFPYEQNYDAKSEFKNRILDEDLNKKLVEYIENSKNKVVVVDLIQERYGLNKISQGYYTYSHDFRVMKLQVGDVIRFDDHYELFKENIDDIVKLLNNYEKVILHEVDLTPVYYKKDGSLGTIPINETDEYYMMNGPKYYNLLKERLNNPLTINIKGYIGTENHKWGRGKAHYEDEYQHRFNEGLDYVIEKNKDFYYLKDFGILGEEVVK